MKNGKKLVRIHIFSAACEFPEQKFAERAACIALHYLQQAPHSATTGCRREDGAQRGKLHSQDKPTIVSYFAAQHFHAGLGSILGSGSIPGSGSITGSG
jgi:hypothetical protein